MFRIPLENSGVSGPGSYLRGPASQVPIDHIRILGPTYGPGPQVPLFRYAINLGGFKSDQKYFARWSGNPPESLKK